MHEDLVESFEFEGEKLGLLFTYSTLYALEKEHDLPLMKLWLALKDLSAIAGPAALLHGLETHRTQVAQRVRRWTIEDAQRIYMALRPTVACGLCLEAIARACIAKEADPAAGKAAADLKPAPAPSGPASTGT